MNIGFSLEIQATLKAKIGGQEISTVVSTSDLSVTKGKVRDC